MIYAFRCECLALETAPDKTTHQLQLTYSLEPGDG